MRNNLWALCFFSFFTLSCFSQETQASSQYSFSLDEAIEFALENGYQSINAKREVAKALQLKWETTAAGLPQIDGSIAYQNQLKQPISVIPSEFFGGEPGTFTPIVFGEQQQASLTATLTQLIFDGSYLVGLEASKSFLQFNQDSEEKVLTEVRKSIINAYGGVLVAQESVNILSKNTEALQKNLDESKKILENGLNEEEDVEQLQITLLQITNQLNNAKRLAVIALQMLNISLGIDVNTKTKLTDTLETLIIKNIDPSITTENFNIENNIDYRLAYLFTEQRRLELKLEKSRALPSISAFVNYNTSAFEEDFIFLNSGTPWFQSSILGASINIPIFSSLRRSARTKQARIALEQSNTDFLETQQQIQLQYNSAISEYTLSLENYEVLKQNLSLAERIENKNQIKYTEGLATSFELRQAQLQLYSVQQEILQSMLSIIKNRATLESILNISK